MIGIYLLRGNEYGLKKWPKDNDILSKGLKTLFLFIFCSSYIYTTYEYFLLGKSYSNTSLILIF